MQSSRVLISALFIFVSRFAASIGAQLFALGGVKWGLLNTVDVYDFDTKKWTVSANLPAAAYEFGAVAHDGHIYAVGGAIGGSASSSSTMVYDAKSDEWSKAPSLTTRRERLGVAALAGKIYAVGGYNADSSYLRSAESFETDHKKWTPIDSMKEARGWLAVAVLADRLYAIGGIDEDKYLASVEAYDPQKNEWSQKVASLKTARAGHAAASADEKIYVFGGFNFEELEKKYLKSVEVYDPKKDEWNFVAEMSAARTTFGAVAHEAKIYVVGGYDREGFFDTVEVYDPKANSWTLLAGQMSSPRAEHAVVLLNREGDERKTPGNNSLRFF